jgi:endonuclease/exonuclease/phosphatase family metal-dependent hydrolase
MTSLAVRAVTHQCSQLKHRTETREKFSWKNKQKSQKKILKVLRFRQTTLLLLLLLCWSLLFAAATVTAAAASARQSVVLRFMSFNLFYGGTSLNLTSGGWCVPKHGCPQNIAQIVRAIQLANADVVGLEETEGNVALVAQQLGGWHYSAKAHVVSRFPLLDPLDGCSARFVMVLVDSTRVVFFTVAHAPASPYGPYSVRDGAALSDVLQLEETFRVPPVLSHLNSFAAAADAVGAPAFVAGDFNSPSDLDWTPAAAQARGLRYAVPWPMSVRLRDVGFKDSFRAVYADPVARPGFTWTPWGPEDEPPGREVMDRVDWVLWRDSPRSQTPATKVLRSAVVGSPDMPLSPWPSDHYAIVSEFETVPVALPAVVSVDRRRVFQGSSMRVFYHGCCSLFLDDQMVVPSGPTNGGEWMNHSSANLLLGQHTWSLRDTSNKAAANPLVAWSDFFVVGESQETVLSIASTTVTSGDSIFVNVSNAPGMMLDYLGVYKCGSGGLDTAVYEYTGGLVFGQVAIEPPFYVEGNEPLWPLPSGCYEIRLFQDDDQTKQVGNTLVIEVVSDRRWIFISVGVGVLLAILVLILAIFFFYKRQHRRQYGVLREGN